MRDHITLHENEQVTTAPTTPKPLHMRIARHISNILSPMAVSLPFVLLVALYHARNLLSVTFYTCTTLFFLSIGPMLYILIGVRQGKFTDVDVSIRSQRVGPFLFAIASALAGLLILLLTGAPKNLQTVMLITVISGIILMTTTLWWKISVHASTLSGALTMLTALYGTIVLPAFLLVILVGWSRVALRRHTLAQVIAGSGVSILLSTLILTIRGI